MFPNCSLHLLAFLFFGVATSLEVDIYFEGCCPDSQRFITGTFQDAWNNDTWRNVTNMTLYPYGKCTQTYNSVTNEYDFQCQHGTKECRANMIMTCAIQDIYTFNSSQYITFIIDYMTKLSEASVCYGLDVVNIAENTCNQQISCNWTQIEQCINSKYGNTAYHSIGILTEKVDLNWVPWIVLNGKHTDEQQKMCEDDLLLCTESMFEEHTKSHKHDSCIHYVVAFSILGVIILILLILIGVVYVITRNKRLKIEETLFQKMSDKGNGKDAIQEHEGQGTSN